MWDEEGHIVTNNHVIANAGNILVTFSDGLTVEAEVVGRAPAADLAVLDVDIPADELPQPVAVADQATLQVGQLAIAIGSPFGQDGSMSLGIISALGRFLPVLEEAGGAISIPDIIQTDAAINPGNSGGVLLNEAGELIGVTTAILSASGTFSGVGFAVPSYIVERVVPELITTGEYERPVLGVLGTQLTPTIREAMGLEPTQRGALIIDVVPGGPAAEAGLLGGENTVTLNGQEVLVDGDIITAVEGETVTDINDVASYLLRNVEIGEAVELTVLRDGDEERVEVTVEAASEADEAPNLAMEVPTQRPQLGILGQDITTALAEELELSLEEGVLVEQVIPGSPAAEAGIEVGDVIVTLGDEEVATIAELRAALTDVEPNDEVTVTVLREGAEEELEVVFPSPESEAPLAEEADEAPETEEETSGLTLGILAQDVTLDVAEVLDLPEGQQGVLVDEVEADTPAEEAGILDNDVIVAFDGEEITSVEELQSVLEEVEPGEEVAVTVLRDGNEEELDVIFPEVDEAVG